MGSSTGRSGDGTGPAPNGGGPVRSLRPSPTLIGVPGLILVNPHSGKDETSASELADRFPGHLVEECAPGEIEARVRLALDRGVSFVAVAGGDGTIRSAAAVLVGTDLPLLPIPAGTRNHFARDVGVPELDDAVAAAAEGDRRKVDVGRVNGHIFVNNSSIGVYPAIVIRREFHQRRLRKPVANLVAVWEQLRHGRRFWVEVAGLRHRVWMVFVGNGRYGEGLLDLADRESLDDHVLDVRVVRADRPLARLRVLGALFLGRLARSPLMHCVTSKSISIDVKRPRMEVALDGEVERIETPLCYESVPEALTVLVPPSGRKMAER
jgi:diacylglycerol kinase family enzyme